MKQLLAIILITILSNTCRAQDLSTKSITELNQMKSQAIANANYIFADKIKTEINYRTATEVNIAQLEANVDADIQAALAIEDYLKAEQLQQKKLKINKLKQLDTQINAAVAQDDFETADKLQQQQKAIKAELTATQAPAQQTYTTPTTPVEENLFMPAATTTQPPNNNQPNNTNPFLGVTNQNNTKVGKSAAITPEIQSVLDMIIQTQPK